MGQSNQYGYSAGPNESAHGGNSLRGMLSHFCIAHKFDRRLCYLSGDGYMLRRVRLKWISECGEERHIVHTLHNIYESN